MIRHWIASLILLPLLLFQGGGSAPLYVAPYGTATALGTPDDPRSLPAALTLGSDVWLLPGTYTGDLTINAPATVRSVPGTRAKIDGAITVNADDVTLQDLEITYTGWTTRTSAHAGSNPPDVNQKWLNVFGKRARILNNVIHDLAGVGWWKTATDSELIGNLIYNNGWRGTDRGHGPGVYSQNNPDGDKLARYNVLGPNYSMTGFEFYGSSIAPLQHYHIEQNVMIGTRFLLGGGQPVVDAHVLGNLLWKSSIEVGYLNPLNGDAEIRDNYVGLGRITPRTLTSLVMTGNTAINSGGVDLMDLRMPTQPYSYTIDANTYLSNRTLVFWNSGILQDFPQWQASGYDAAGTLGGLPTQAKVFVQPTRPHHGYVAVYNWGNAQAVPVDLSALSLTPGASYKLVNSLNTGEVLPFVASSSPVSLLTASWSVAAPIGAAAPLVPWSSSFLSFLVEPA
jgi:hypothetical protein